MMTIESRLVPALIVLGPLSILTGCWTCSLQPLAEPNDPHIVYDSALEGKWKSPDDDCLLVISGDAQARSYTLTYSPTSQYPDACHDERNKPGIDDAGPFAGRLVELSNHRFLDVVPSFERGNVQESWGYIPGHSIFEVRVSGPRLTLEAPDGDWLCGDELAQQLGTCKYEIGSYDFTFTASTEVVQDFVAKHAGDDHLFPAAEPDRALQRIGESDPKVPQTFAARPGSIARPPWGGYFLNSLVTTDDPRRIYEPALEGIWKHPDRDDYCLLVIRGNANYRYYTLEFSEPPKHSGNCGGKRAEHGVNEAGPFSAWLVQLGNDRFLDVVPDEDEAEKPSLFSSLGYLPVHSILRVTVDHKTLWLTDSRDPCRETLYATHTMGEDQPVIGICQGYSPAAMHSGQFLVTANTDVLQDFIAKHAHDGVAFPNDNQGDYRLRIGKPGAAK